MKRIHYYIILIVFCFSCNQGLEANKVILEEADAKQAKTATEEDFDGIMIDTLESSNKNNNRVDREGWNSLDIIDSTTIYYRFGTINNDYQTNFKRNQSSIIEQKLQEYYDLLLLEKTHPEFKQETQEQLDRLANFKAIVNDTTANIRITNMRYISGRQFENSSELFYTIFYSNNKQKDSIRTIIKSTKLKVNNDTLYDQKVRFERLFKIP